MISMLKTGLKITGYLIATVAKPSLTWQRSSLKPTVMVVDKKQKTKLDSNRGIPKTQRVLESTKKNQVQIQWGSTLFCIPGNPSFCF